MQGSLNREYFDELYRAKADPWDFQTSDYETGKYAASLAALPDLHYDNVLEIGCSIGVFTASLANRCSSLLAIDTAVAALSQAQQRCKDLPQVKFELMSVPQQFPRGLFNLIVMAEVGYYLSAEDLQKTADLIVEHSASHAQLLLVHWLPKVPDYPLTGDTVHEYFIGRPEWRTRANVKEEKYRIDVLERRETSDADASRNVVSDPAVHL